VIQANSSAVITARKKSFNTRQNLRQHSYMYITLSERIRLCRQRKSHILHRLKTTSRPWRYTAHAQMILPRKQPRDASPYVRGTPTPTPGRHVW